MSAHYCGCLEMVEMLFGTTFLVCMCEHELAMLFFTQASNPRLSEISKKFTLGSAQVVARKELQF